MECAEAYGMIYDYKCLSCGNAFQQDFPIHTKIRNGKHIKARCPLCKSRHVKKRLHRVEVHYKGNGFYSTDHKIPPKETK